MRVARAWNGVVSGHQPGAVRARVVGTEAGAGVKVFFVVAMENIHAGEFDHLRRGVGATRLVVPPPRAATTRPGIWARLVAHELRAFPQLLTVIMREPDEVALVCSTAQYAALMAARVAALLGRHPRVYLYNFYLHALGRIRLVRALLRLVLTTSVGILAWSPHEVDYFSSLAPGMHIDYFPYAGQNIEGVPSEAVGIGSHVFAGGYANRDYATLIAAARELPELPFTVICTAANRLPSNLPPNVQVLRNVAPGEFYKRLAGSLCVVLPMEYDVGSSGQMVALAAMQFGKLTLYTDFPCVSQYFTNGETGIAFGAGDVHGLCRQLAAVAHDEGLAARIGAAARKHWESEFVSGYAERIAESATRFLTGALDVGEDAADAPKARGRAAARGS